jgi:exodeoxyribonuclease V gamma subunit
MSCLIFSNKLEKLADALIEDLFAPGTSIFECRYVIVPQEHTKNFLQRYIASKLGIAAGMRICSIEQVLAEAISERIPSVFELAVRIEEQIRINPEEAVAAYLGADPVLRDQRASFLSEQLARLFILYALHGSDWLKKDGWQQRIWRAVFSAPEILSLDRIAERRVPRMHLFGFGYLWPLYLAACVESGSTFYFFSPCATYWGDFCSDREKLGIQRSLHKAAKEEMRQYLQEHHPLLANWGKWGREFLKNLDAYALDVREMYEESKPSVLGAVQNSMLYSQEFAAPSDSSIQIHSAPSKLREVEVLRDVLGGLPIQPKDILICAPDISAYLPYIQMVFAPGVYRVEGLEQGSQSLLCQAYYHLLSLAEKEVSLSGMMRLFSFEVFRKSWCFSLEDVELIRSWLERAEVRTGDASWQAGIDRLLFGMALPSDHAEIGVVSIAQSDLSLLNRFLVCYAAIRQDILKMRASERKTVHEWLTWVEELLARHFHSDREGEPIVWDIGELRSHTASLQAACFTFASIRKILQRFYEKRSASLPAAHQQCLRLCSLKSGIASPHRVIYLLGMDEESFPRRELPNSLSLLGAQKAHEDRYLFLELLCSAQEYFILSYERMHPLDHKPQGPCYLIDELRSFIQQTCLELEHPFFSFDAVYFAENAPVRSANPYDFLLAKSYYNPGKEPRQFFSPQEARAREQIRISELHALAKNPIKFYCNQALGIYLEAKSEEDAFCLSGLTKYALRKAALQSNWEKALKKGEAQGLLPQGLFKTVAVRNLSAEIREQQKILATVSEVFSAELSLQCRQPLRLSNGNWTLPALSFSGMYITGTFSHITPQGYLVQGKKDKERLFSEWPLYLIFLNIRHHFGDLPSKMFFLQDGQELELPLDNPRLYLERYVRYFLKSCASLSPCMPKGEPSERDPYWQWMQRSGIAIDTAALYDQWSAELQQVFEPLWIF